MIAELAATAAAGNVDDAAAACRGCVAAVDWRAARVWGCICRVQLRACVCKQEGPHTPPAHCSVARRAGQLKHKLVCKHTVPLPLLLLLLLLLWLVVVSLEQSTPGRWREGTAPLPLLIVIVILIVILIEVVVVFVLLLILVCTHVKGVACRDGGEEHAGGGGTGCQRGG